MSGFGDIFKEVARQDPKYRAYEAKAGIQRALANKRRDERLQFLIDLFVLTDGMIQVPASLARIRKGWKASAVAFTNALQILEGDGSIRVDDSTKSRMQVFLTAKGALAAESVLASQELVVVPVSAFVAKNSKG